MFSEISSKVSSAVGNFSSMSALNKPVPAPMSRITGFSRSIPQPRPQRVILVHLRDHILPLGVVFCRDASNAFLICSMIVPPPDKSKSDKIPDRFVSERKNISPDIGTGFWVKKGESAMLFTCSRHQTIQAWTGMSRPQNPPGAFLPVRLLSATDSILSGTRYIDPPDQNQSLQ